MVSLHRIKPRAKASRTNPVISGVTVLVSVILMASGPADMASAAAGHVEKKDMRTVQEARKKAIEEQKRSDQFLSLFSRAREYKKEGRLRSARSYAKKALEVEPDNKEARRFLEGIEMSEQEAEKKKTASDEAEKNVRARLTEALVDSEKDDTARIRREKKISKRLEQARQAVEGNDPAAARTYLGQARALGADEDRIVAVEQDIAEMQSPAPRSEAPEKDSRERLGEYIDKAGKELKDKDFREARKAAGKALDLDPANVQATGLMSRIQRAKLQYEQEQRGQREKEREARKKAEKKARSDREVARYMALAEENRLRDDFIDARRYAEKALKSAPAGEKENINEYIEQVATEQMYFDKTRARTENARQAEKAVQNMEQSEDPFTRYNEEKNWIEFLMEPFEKEPFTIGRVRDGKVYSIDRCVDIALKRSQRMVSFREQVKLAEMRIWEARRDLLPSLSFQREISTGKVSANSYIRHYKGEKWAFESKWTAFDGFGSWNMLQQAQANLETVKLEEKKVRGQIIEETKKAYYNLDKAYKNLEMQLENRERVEQFYDITSKAYDSELVPHVDYLNVKGLNLQTGFQYISAEEDVDLAELVLFQAMNLDPDSEIGIEPVERPQELISVGLENCYRLALSNNPNYQTKINALKYYELERKIMRAKGYPKIDLHWSAGKMVEKFEPMFLPADYTSPDNAGSPARADRGFEPEWFFGVKSSVPLWGNTLEHNYVREQWAPTVSAFRGTQTATSYFTVNVLDDLAYFSNLQESRAGFERAKYEQQKAKQDLIIQVKEIYFKYRKALLNIEVAEAKLDHQEKYVSVLAERHRFGEMNMPALIEEYEKLIEFEYALLSAYTDYYISIVQLNAAIGISDYFKAPYEKKAHQEFMADPGDGSARTGNGKEADPAKAAEYLEKARRFIRRGDLKTARDMARKARQYAPDSAGARAVAREIDDALTGGRT